MKILFHLYFEIKLFLFLRNRKVIGFEPVVITDFCVDPAYEKVYVLWFGVRDRFIFRLEKDHMVDCLVRIDNDRWKSDKKLSKFNSNIIAKKINEWRLEQIKSLN